MMGLVEQVKNSFREWSASWQTLTWEALTPPSIPEIRARLEVWIRENGKYWGASAAIHVVILLLLGLVLGTLHVARQMSAAPSFEADLETELPDSNLTRFEVGETPLEPSVLNTETLSLNEALPIEQTEQYNDESPEFEEAGGGLANRNGPSFGGLGGFDVKALGEGPVVSGPGGVGTGAGAGMNSGTGGAGVGFAGRGSGSRQAMVGGFGGTKGSERAVAAGLNWLARHQNTDGSWSLDQFRRHCKDGTCSGQASVASDAAATAFGLLPFLAAGQTHESKGPYQKVISTGITWLVRNQTSDGCLATNSDEKMYSHGLAAIALCEAYGLSKDRRLGGPAQQAVKFIETTQHSGGSWNYTPSPPSEGDTSIVGWQIMALKSAQMAGLKVSTRTLEKAKGFLRTVSSGQEKGLYGYKPGTKATHTLTSIGMLCMQYMGMQRDDPAMVEGKNFMMLYLPNQVNRNSYYWYYATQAMHNMPGPEWDTWNRRLRRILIETQVKEGCAAGSWDPDKPVRDALGDVGGRVMVTSMAVLSLEVYYRYLPLYQLDSKSEPNEVPDAEPGA